MKPVLSLLFFLFYLTGQAQENYSISGLVSDAKGETLPGATVFLDGSQKKTSTNENGQFILTDLAPGTYQLTVHFVGYHPVSKNVIIQDKAVSLALTLQENATALREVVIKRNPVREKYMNIFIKNFLGDTPNAATCFIENAEILQFKEVSYNVEAHTNDFLIITNQSLGYRIKYLLRNFKYNRLSNIASYTGECIYEELKGTSAQIDEWEKHRKEAYEGSMMHYLRMLYVDSLTQNGFFTYQVRGNTASSLQVDQRVLSKAELTKGTNGTLMTMKFSGYVYIVFDPEDKHTKNPEANSERISNSSRENTGSLVQLYLPKANVDAKGRYVDFKSFLVKGYWGGKRLGDQLPFEYGIK